MAPTATRHIRPFELLFKAGRQSRGLERLAPDVRPPRRHKSKPGNGDAACGSDAALHPERVKGPLPMRAQVGPWASLPFNLMLVSPLRDFGLPAPRTVDAPCGLARRVSLGGLTA